MAGSKAQPKGSPNSPDVDRKTARGKGKGGFNPHPDGTNDNDFQDEDRSKVQARQVTPAGKARSK